MKPRPTYTVNGVPFDTNERAAREWARNLGAGGLYAVVWMRAGSWAIMVERWEHGRRTFPSGKVERWRRAV